jgi:glycosyltransferase involved in cell wall biosynthesis
MNDRPAASVVITTRNRRADLERALRSVRNQTAILETIVLDDASDDGTQDLVAEDFPEVRYWRSETQLGYIALRNLGAEMARAPIIISIDDDAEFSTPEVVSQTLAEFDHPGIGAVSIPYLDDVPGGRAARVRPAVDGRRWVVWAYTGTSHAVRRDVFELSGGYEPALVHFGEEFDFALRMLDKGYAIRLGRADPIFHHLSPKSRESNRIWLSGERSYVLSASLLVPAPYLLPALLRLLAYAAVHVIQGAPPTAVARGVERGYDAAWKLRSRRRPVAISTYRLRNKIRFSGPLVLDDIDGRLARKRG